LYKKVNGIFLVNTPQKIPKALAFGIFYPSRRLGIDARRLAIPSLRSLHRRTTCGVYHQPLWGWISLRLDDIQPYGLMIYRNELRMISTPSA
jgi:hypothetical protein